MIPAEFPLPRIYPITYRDISGLSHLEQVERLIEGGATMIQLRDKTASSSELFNAARGCLALARKHGVKLIINDRVDIVLALGADGVHLGQDDLPPVHARKILGGDAIIGFSTHSVEQAIGAAGKPVNYIAIGPIFETQSKEKPEPLVGLDGLRRVREATRNIPLVAIGGITSENLIDVFAAGADSAAMIGALLADPHQIAEQIQKMLDLVHKSR